MKKISTGFCNQCALELTDAGVLVGDFREKGKRFTRVVLCDGCGTTLVDMDGNCVGSTCNHRKEV